MISDNLKKIIKLDSKNKLPLKYHQSIYKKYLFKIKIDVTIQNHQ